MGTRGIYTIIYKGKYYIFYNHSDSYPEALGVLLILLIQNNDISKWGEILVDKIDNKNWTITKFICSKETFFDFKKKEYNIGDDLDFENSDKYNKQYFTFDNETITLNKWDIMHLNSHCVYFDVAMKKLCPTLLRSSLITTTNDTKAAIDLFESYSWYYTINLDKQIFSVGTGKFKYYIEYNLNCIPFNWIDELKEKMK